MEEFIIVNSTKYFKFKQSWQKLFYQLQCNHQRAVVVIFVIICITLSVYFLQRSDEAINKTAFGDKPASSNNKNDGRVAKGVSGGTLSYRINNDFSELKNPFSFEHETEAKSSKQMDSSVRIESDNIAGKLSSDVPTNIEPQRSMTAEMNGSEHKAMSDNRKCKLEAIMQLGQHKTALLNVDGKSFRVHVGDEVAGIVVMSLDNRKITLRMEDGKMATYRLRE